MLRVARLLLSENSGGSTGTFSMTPFDQSFVSKLEKSDIANSLATSPWPWPWVPWSLGPSVEAKIGGASGAAVHFFSANFSLDFNALSTSSNKSSNAWCQSRCLVKLEVRTKSRMPGCLEGKRELQKQWSWIQCFYMFPYQQFDAFKAVFNPFVVRFIAYVTKGRQMDEGPATSFQSGFSIPSLEGAGSQTGTYELLYGCLWSPCHLLFILFYKGNYVFLQSCLQAKTTYFSPC